MAMQRFLREREMMEQVISSEQSGLAERIEAVAVLLQHPLDKNLRVDLHRMFLEWTDELASRSTH
ncbi:hypothetical protein HQ945_08980 [Phyllobacterium sp. BT25]|uniref:Uncharacterized protein n=1 Tax=Phyllobacterium pellucidum TaxID=2740464 RepID=A0A849VML4_9HYPH|nr:hypothetical protein [Phyllobacterium pellucidum]NTS31385.1 hypothetical protein [Phyllobacterium pellucidum]